MEKVSLLSEGRRTRLAEVFKEYPYIIVVYQYGSTVCGKAGPLSDLDIALLLDETAPSRVAMSRVEGLLAYRIRQSLDDQPREIDVISLNERSFIFQHTVLRTGGVIYDANPQARRHYEWKIIRAYLDFEPTLRWVSQFQKEGWLRRCGLR
jgi:predicted nucleotidyltransferase